MNDDELIMLLQEQRGKAAMTTPVEQIISRGRALRARRRIPRAAGAAGAAAVSAIAVGVALPASHPAASNPAASRRALDPDARLAAWTVTRQPNGNIKVTFREATDPAGLQRTLRADGIPASVTFSGQQNPACHGYPMSRAPRLGPAGAYQHQLSRFPLSTVLGPTVRNLMSAFHHPLDAMVIHPAALRPGVGIQIWTSGTPGAADNFQLHVRLVRASPQCTGS
jgi:hypothetical protein